MSIRSKFNEDEIRKLDKEKYMNNSSFDDIMQYSDKVFDVAALIRDQLILKNRREHLLYKKIWYLI